MAILNSILGWIIKKRMHQIELFMKYPCEVQEELLRKLISTAEHTQWGEHFEYQSIDNFKTFSERVPVVTYDQLQPQVERIMKGEQNILWPSEIKWFAKSSGTTSNRSKFIPVSMESLEECHFKGGKDLLSIYFNNNPDALLFNGKRAFFRFVMIQGPCCSLQFVIIILLVERITYRPFDARPGYHIRTVPVHQEREALLF